MHILGYIDHAYLSPTNKVVLEVVNIIGNTGVSCFVLISGYFGVKYNTHKFLYLVIMSSIYSVLVVYLNDGICPKELIKAFLIIPRYKLWFIVCYLFLMLLSPYLNQLADTHEKKDFSRLIAIMTILLCVIPTVFAEAAWSSVILHQGGKNLTYFLFLYLLGRYIKKYYDNNYSRIKLYSIHLLSSIVIAVVAIFTDILLVDDCSIFILVSSLALFFFFKSFCFHSRLINYISSSVLAIYVLNWIYIYIDREFIHLQGYASSNSFAVYLLAEVVAVSLIALVIDKFVGTFVNKVMIGIENKFNTIRHNS